MKKMILATATATATLVAVPAFAQDAGTFSGVRAEVIAGFGTNEFDSNDVEDDVDDVSQNLDGFIGGINLGYDFPAGNVVVGVEAEGTLSSADRRLTDSELDGIGATASFGAGRDLYVGLRAGVLVREDILLYAKGGYTNTRFEIDVDVEDESAEFGANFDGFRVGAGVELATSDNFFVKLEYRYSQYSVDSFTVEDTLLEVDADLTRHQGVLGFGFRF